MRGDGRTGEVWTVRNDDADRYLYLSRLCCYLVKTRDSSASPRASKSGLLCSNHKPYLLCTATHVRRVFGT